MRLYEIARELNYSMEELDQQKEQLGLINCYAFSAVPDVVAEKIRKSLKKRDANPCLEKQKPKVKRVAKKKPIAKPKKIVRKGSASDSAEETAEEIVVDPDSQIATEESTREAITPKVEAPPEVEGEVHGADEEVEGQDNETSEGQKGSGRKQDLNLGRLGDGEQGNEFEVGRIVAQAPAPKQQNKKKKRKNMLEQADRETEWSQKYTNFNQQLLPKKNQNETKGSMLQRMQLVYGHELPQKNRKRDDSEKRIKKNEDKKEITLPINIRDLSEKLGVKATDVIKFLMGQGVFLTITDVLDKGTAENIAMHFEKDIIFTEEKEVVDVIKDIVKDAKDDQDVELSVRPPIVTIMGHVDHGKTSLLDKIRESNLAEKETGGITQHIGGYQVEKDGYKMTFLDTPGHAAFTAMRARGAQVTDVVVLVVAADDGMMPQTEEAVNHARSAGVPIVVAINKMDLEGANPDRIKEQLATLELIPEEWSGSTPYVPVSAKTGEGIDNLLEMIHLQAEMLELKTDFNSLGSGVVIEAHQEAGKGVVASMLVREGFFKKGDPILCGQGQGWLRQMEDENLKVVQEAGPSKIVKIMGLSDCPSPGDQINVMPNIKKAKELADDRKAKAREKQIQDRQAMSIESLMDKLGAAASKSHNILIKADVQGTVEALDQALSELGNEEVKANIIHKGVGAVTESDVLLAKASSAMIVAFRVAAVSKARKTAMDEGVEIKTYAVIYELINDIQDQLEGMLDPDTIETVIGEVEVRQVFKISNVGTIAGSYVKSGYVERNMPVRLMRDGVVVYTGKVQALRRFKDDVKRVEQRYECGIRLENYDDIRVEDILETYVLETVKKKFEEAT